VLVAVDDLGPRGRRLWSALCEQVNGESGLVMLEEACRIADRLDRLDALLIGDRDSWARIDQRRDGSLELVIDSALTEARQQAAVLRQLLASIPVKESGDGDPDSWLNDLPAEVRNS
jgi:hypothetical protein